MISRSGSAGSTPSTRRPAALIAGITGWHAPALLLVLFAFFPLVVVDSVWSADIGVRLYQAKALLTTGLWDVAHPLPRADPEGLYFPIHLSSATDNNFRYIPLPKHPALVWLTAALYRLGGGSDGHALSSIVAIQTVSTFAAALGTSRLIGRIRPSLVVPTLWFTGLLSPLFFDAYLGYAHSLAAAFVVWAAVLTLQFTDPLPLGTSSDGIHLVTATFLLALACLVRTEASLLGLATAGGLVVAGWSRTDRGRWIFAAVAFALTTASATVTDRLLGPPTTGLANPGHAVDVWGGLTGRLEGMQQTLLMPGHNTSDVLVLIAAALVLAAGFLVGRGRGERPIAEVLLIMAATAIMGRLATGQPLLVFGLFMAFPLLLVGLVRGVGSFWTTSESRFCMTTFVLFFGAVIMTQYRFGGVAEWGGRYFAAGLPFGIVPAVLGLGNALAPLPERRSRSIAALAVVPALLLNLGGLHSLRNSRLSTAAMVDEISEAMATIRLRGAATGDTSVVVDVAPGEDDRPVVVTTVPPIGRLSWSEVDNGRWLLVDDGELGPTARRLSDLGVRRFVLVTFDPDTELAEIGRFYGVDSWQTTEDVPGHVVIVSAVDR